MVRPPLPKVGKDNRTWGTKNNAVLEDAQESLDRVDPALAPSGRRVQQRVVDRVAEWYLVPEYDPRDWGCACDGVTDDTANFQAMLDDIAKTAGVDENLNGGRIITPGHIRITATLVPKCRSIGIVGMARRNVQTSILGTGLPALAGAPPTIINDHNGPFMSFRHANRVNGFYARDVTFVNLGERTSNEIAFDWDLAGNGNFMRDFTFHRVTITGFYAAFVTRATSTQGSGSDSQVGMLRVFDCNIMHNSWIAKCLNSTWWNGFYFAMNDAGNNGYAEGRGGIDISGHLITITENILEGQRDPIKVSTVLGRASRIAGNYFELNVGRACIDVSQQSAIDIGPNNYGSVSTTHKVLIRDGSGGGRCLDRWWPNKAVKVHPAPNAIVGSSLSELEFSAGQLDDAPWILMDAPRDDFLAVPRGASAIRADAPSSPVPAPAPFRPPGSGYNMPVETTTLDSTGRISYSYAGYGGTLGDILVATFIFRLKDARGTASIYLQVSPEGIASNGFDGSVPYDRLCFRDDGWRVLNIAIKPKATWTYLTIGLYPYGINASGVTGKVVEHRKPTVYKAASVNDIQPFIWRPFSSSALPSTGTWGVSDTIINSAPAAAGAERWVCTTAGTPGTWKGLLLES